MEWGGGCLLRRPRLLGWSAYWNRLPRPPPPPRARALALGAPRGLCSWEQGRWLPHPRDPGWAARSLSPQLPTFVVLQKSRQLGDGAPAAAACPSPRSRPDPKAREEAEPPAAPLPAPHLPPPAFPQPTRTRKGRGGAGSPLPSFARNSAKLPSFRLHLGSLARPGRSPAKPSQVLINHVRYFVHHTSRHLIQGQQRQEGKKKKSLNANPAKPVFLFFSLVNPKNAPREVVADSFLKEEGGEKSPWLLTLSRSPSAFLSSLALQRTGALLFLSLYCRYIFFSPPLLATLFCLFVCNTALLCKHITHGPRAVQTADCSKMLPNHRGPESFFKSKEKKKM